jgi:hypothetical protein
MCFPGAREKRKGITDLTSERGGGAEATYICMWEERERELLAHTIFRMSVEKNVRVTSTLNKPVEVSEITQKASYMKTH